MAAPFLSASWYRVAGLRPELRAHARIQRQRFRGQAWYVVHDRASGKLHRFSPAAYGVIQLLDGRRTVDEVWREVAARSGSEAPTQDEVIRLLAQLHAADLLQADLPPDVDELAERGSQQKRRKLLQSFINPMSMRIPLWDPDDFLSRTWPLVRPLAGWLGLVVWLLAVLPGIVLAGVHWPELTANLSDQVLATKNLLLLWLIYPLIKALHELAHGYAVKSGDGEVHEMGLMLLVLAPVPYVDATASGAFRSKWRRAFVGAAGMLVELFLAGIAMIVWALVEPGLVRSIAFNVVLVGGASTLLFNGNPLLRYDGYYVLSDLIEIPNLGGRSNQYWQWLAKRHLFGVTAVERPVATAGERRWFSFYGAASFVYRTLVMIAIALFIAGEFFFVGVVLAIWAAITMFVVPLVKAIAYIQSSPELQRTRTRARLVAYGGLAALALFVLLVPLPLRTHAEGVVWVPENAEVRTGADGFVEQLFVAPDAQVAAGEVLVVTAAPELSAEVAEGQARVRQFAVQYTALMFDERVQAAAVLEDLQRERVALARAEEKLASLAVVAGVPGAIKLARAQDLPGRYVKKGELLGYIVSGPPRLVRAVVRQDDIALVRERRTAVEVKITDRLAHTYPARVLREVPGGHDRLPHKALALAGGGPHGTDPRDPDGLRSLQRLFQFDLELPEDVGAVDIGTRVYVRFHHHAEPLAAQWGRRLRQLFLARFNV
ncbi:PqqD family peptide modification chaperone [Accumulibacter sp.]|uniref:PqqD family peptide modification chaperone n=1 Tax=Accumulibacter sp. TaxID=2053492 RepID=UPI0025D172BE|nr:PqqD family peptide modification chaperone [Accumulibacter sp.]MCM8594075.1 PqqD family peptide modification chaperone [Accumulibacter sp.]MCM8624483.1 PqqD family peptide modification chaperone [Accumulibacter sp.]MDS4048219.1 PqqD family peptide modification chaperone [Accumulibacter sp.]